MPKKRVIILGATGSIGTSALHIIRSHPDSFELVAVSAHSRSDELLSITREFNLSSAVLSGVESGTSLPDGLKGGTPALLAMIRQTEADIVLNGIAGSAGLSPSVTALESGKDLALANKETIVMAGPLIRELARSKNKSILPVDSEHSAVFNLLSAYGAESVSRIILTASGGPFRQWTSEQLKNARAQDALKHPTWSMGAKITIDSASLANKGLEVIEACRLFDFAPDKIDVVVHPESLVHSMIRTKDGVLYAQMSRPDMCHPILSALSWPTILENTIKPLSLETPFSMHFEKPRYDDFPLLGLAFKAAAMGGAWPLAYNASNEVAVAAFLNGTLSFTNLSRVTAEIMEKDWSREASNFEEIFTLDEQARIMAKQITKGLQQ